ncbi:MAG: murein biosynthesis integral membrane protein MurJ [Brachymonas denitrificans]|uniref:murein biosynthesis integral membrane protein MurJ n=1 Tax=Brachymonas denitrificans TaxID=28220 RepID=UPI00352DBCD0
MSLFKSASTVSLLTLASRITGLIRELLIASAFGASAFTDAFNVAFRIPNLFRRLFAEGAFSQAFVPVLAAAREQEGDAATHRMIDRVATVLFWVLVVFCALGVLFAPLLVWLMASGLKKNPEGFEAAVVMTRWIFPYIGFMSLVALAAGVLNSWKRYAVPAATPVLLNIAMIAAAWLGGPWFGRMGIHPVYALCLGVMVGGVLQLGTQLWALHRLGMFPRIGMSVSAMREALADPHTRRIAKLMLPAILGVSVAQISLLINTQIASHLAAGSVSWLSYADRLMEFPTAMLGVALGVVLMPQLARAKASGDAQAYSSMLDWGLRLVVLLAVPCAVALLAFSKPLVSVLYHYGAFRSTDVEQTTLALMGYGAGLVGLVAIKVLAPAYYARQDIKTPVKIAIGVLIATQLMNLVFVPRLAVGGLSLSIALAAMLNAGMLLAGLLRRGSYRPEPGWAKFSLQVLAATLLMFAFLLWADGLPWVEVQSKLWRIGQFVAVVVGAAVLYFGALALGGFRLRQLLRR